MTISFKIKHDTKYRKRNNINIIQKLYIPLYYIISYYITLYMNLHQIILQYYM